MVIARHLIHGEEIAHEIHGETFLGISPEIEIRSVYSPEDIKDFDYWRDLGSPRRISPSPAGFTLPCIGKRLWTMRQFAGFGIAEESNKRYRYLLKQGNTGLSVAFDMPTLMGYDSDDPRSRGEVGRCGVAIDSLSDMEALFRDIPLDQVSVSMTINGPAIVLFAMYLVVAERQGLALEISKERYRTIS